jgi:signal transduction histidine kinase
MKRLSIFKPKILNIIFFVLLNVLSILPQWNSILAKDIISQKYKENQQKIEILLDSYNNSHDSKQKLEYLDQIILIANHGQLKKSEANALYLSGVEWKKRGEYSEALEKINLSLLIYKELEDVPNIVKVKTELADVYRSISRFNEAISILESSISYYKVEKDTIQLAQIHNRFAAIYLELFFNSYNYKTIYKDSASSKKEFLDKMNQFPILKNYYSKILYHLDLSNRYAKFKEIKSLLISNLIINGQFDIVCYDINNGIAKFDYALKLIEETGIKDEKPLALINKARVLGVWRMNKPQEAIKMAYEALELATKMQIRIYIFMATNVLHENYYAINDYKNAYKYLTNSANLFNQLRSENTTIKLQSTNIHKKIEAREKEIQHKKNQQKILLISIFALTVLFSLFIIVLMVKNQKQKKLLLDLHEKSLIISNQNNELHSLIAEKDRLFSIIGHDLRTPFNSILGFGELIYEDSNQLTKEEIQTYSSYIVQSSKNTLYLLENLLIWAKLQQNRIVFDPKELNLQKVINEVVLLLREPLKDKLITLNNNISDFSFVFADEEMLKTIFRNIIGNAIKFSYKNGTIDISSSETGSVTKISIQDHGIGMKFEDLEKLYQFDTTVIRTGTQNEKGSGMGLIISKEIVEKHGGTIWVESTEGVGTTFFFTIPKISLKK